MESLSPTGNPGLVDSTSESSFTSSTATIIVPDGQSDLLLRPGAPVGRLFYGAGKQAFRAGGVTKATWNDQLVGRFSLACGLDTEASGEGAMAAGHATLASGPYAVALGLDTQATGYFAMATGAFNNATGAGSFAAGANNVASGDYTSAFGCGTVAASPAEFALGQYNTVRLEHAASSDTRRILVVGNGQGPDARSDGFTVFQDGTVELPDLKETPKHAAGRLYRLNGKLHYGTESLVCINNNSSTQLGQGASAVGLGSVAIGDYNNASGNHAVSLGGYSTASGKGAVAMGIGANAEGMFAVALGHLTEASGAYSFAAGDCSKASGEGAVAMGKSTEASGYYAVALGEFSIASAFGSVAVGRANATAVNAVALGQVNASGKHSFAVGYNSETVGMGAVAMGEENKASGNHAVALGINSSASGEGAMAMGRQCKATGGGAVAMGNATAIGDFSFAVGYGSETGITSEREETTAYAGELQSRGKFAVAMGHHAKAIGQSSFAVGSQTEAGHAAVAMGDGTKAHGKYAFAVGQNTQASAAHSLAAGNHTVAAGACETALGSYNTQSTDKGRIFSIGIGKSEQQRRDALVAFDTGRILINNTRAHQSDRDLLPSYRPAQLQINASEDSDGLTIVSNSSGNSVNIIKVEGDSKPYISFIYNTSSCREIGSIKANGGNNIQFLTSSDARLKHDQGLLKGSLSLLGRIRIRKFTWQADGTPDVGVFAQELYEVYPQAVEKGDDSPDIQKRWMVDYSKLQPLAIAAIQELEQTVTKQQQQIDELRQQMTALMAQLQK